MMKMPENRQRKNVGLREAETLILNYTNISSTLDVRIRCKQP
jgi:hypothetical protein